MSIKSKSWKFWDKLKSLSVEKSCNCINEWERIHLLTKINENNDGFTCICGQVGLEHLHYFQNKINKNEIIVGSVCVKQFMHDHYDQIKKSISYLKKSIRDTKKLINYRCETCLSYCEKINCRSCKFINDNHIQQLCKEGYIKRLRNKDYSYMKRFEKVQIKYLDLKKANRKEIKGHQIKLLELQQELKLWDRTYDFDPEEIV